MTQITVIEDIDNKKSNISKGFIRYEKKSSGEFASYYKSCYRNGNSVLHDIEYLGKVLDKEKGIFKNNKKGIFTFSIEDKYGLAPSNFVNTTTNININTNTINTTNDTKYPKLSLNFGKIWIYDELIKITGISLILESVFPDIYDFVKSIIAYKLLNPGKSYSYANIWYEYSYVQFLYPNANIYSQEISRKLAIIGDECNIREFFKSYIENIYKNNFNNYLEINKSTEQNYIENDLINQSEEYNYTIPIIIDSTDLPNNINIDITAPTAQNGKLTDEIRLIYIVNRKTGLPIYFRYVPGNIVDVTTLNNTISELKTYNINIDSLIADAGYYSIDNIKDLFTLAIPFLTRVPPNRKIYKNIINDNIDDIDDSKYLERYNKRILHIKMVPWEINNNICFAYIVLDFDKQIKEYYKLAFNGIEDNISKDEIAKLKKKCGLFMLLSSINLQTKDIIPFYYSRQSIEQIFDVSKNNADIIPLRTHSEITLRGHLLISFITTILYLILTIKLKGSSYNALNAIEIFEGLKINMYDNVKVITEPVKKMKEVAKNLDFIIPKLESQLSQNLSLLKHMKRSRGRPKKVNTDLGVQSKQLKGSTKSTQQSEGVSKRQRGRPRKDPQQSEGVPKRQRGRPRKDPQQPGGGQAT